MKENHYRHLGVMAALSFLAMYVLMYAMVNSVSNVYMNVNQVYMAVVVKFQLTRERAKPGFRPRRSTCFPSRVWLAGTPFWQSVARSVVIRLKETGD